MSTQADYTAEEWDLIVSGPVVAGTTIVFADPALFGSIKESAAIAKAINDYGQTSSVELIQAIGAAVRGGQKPKTPQVPKEQGPKGALKYLIAESRRAVDLVQGKSPEEAEPYAQYLLDIAQKTAESSKEGGFLGIGATRVSEQEKAVLARLAEELDLKTDESAEGHESLETE